MWFSDRRAFLVGLASLAGLAGCRFTPAYAPGGTGRALTGAVRADDPVSRNDYSFVAALEERLGRPEAPRFALSYRIGLQFVGGGSSRVQLFGTLDFVLSDIATGLERAAGRIEGNAGYSTTSTQLAEQIAAEDAELRLMRMLADGLITRLLTTSGLAEA